jgi:hypothetical protein
MYMNYVGSTQYLINITIYSGIPLLFGHYEAWNCMYLRVFSLYYNKIMAKQLDQGEWPLWRQLLINNMRGSAVLYFPGKRSPVGHPPDQPSLYASLATILYQN